MSRPCSQRATHPLGVGVSLREYRSGSAAAAGAVTTETRAGRYLGPSFLCRADRSDERVTTERTGVAIAPTEASIRFAVSYLAGDFTAQPAARHQAPAATAYEIRCSLGGAGPRCTPPPAIGGYDAAGGN